MPAGTSRLRVTLSAAHTDAHLHGLVDALLRVLPPVSAARTEMGSE